MRHRSGGPRRAASRADERQPEGHRDACRRRHRQGRHRAARQGARDRACQHRPAGRRRGRGDHHRACRRGHRHHRRLRGDATRPCWKTPISISRTVLSKGLDAGTAFEILSIDIADVDVGRNIGAQLQMDQAEADRRIAQAKAEERRAMAVAREQEMKAAVQEHARQGRRGRGRGARAPWRPRCASGKLGVMDYYEMQNIHRRHGHARFHCFHGRGRKRAAQEVNREGRGAKHGRNAAVSAGRRVLCDR